MTVTPHGREWIWDKLRGLGRDVVVSGTTGYVGRHILAELLSRGCRAHAIGRRSLTSGALAGLAPLAGLDGEISVLGHDGTTDGISRALAGLDDPVVIHLAGHFVSVHEPGDLEPLLEGNIAFSARLFDAMSQAGARAIVNIGTGWEHAETGRYDPVNLYAAMKQASQRILDFYVADRGFRAMTVKLLDTYGGDDPRRKLLPQLRRAAATGDRIGLTSGDQRINLTYIDDVCDALAAAACHVAGAPLPDHELALLLADESPSLQELVAIIEEVTGRRLDVDWGTYPSHPRQRQSPWRGAPRVPGWAPRVSIRAGIGRYFGG